MPLTVIDAKCENLGTNSVKIVVEGDSIEEATSTKAKEAAIMGARSRGMFRAGISSSSGPYPVNERGEDCTLQAQPGMRYRNEYTLSGGLGA